MNIARPNPFCEALSAPQRMGFRYGKILYTEDVGGSSPSSPTIKSSTYGEFAKTHRGSVNLANAYSPCYLGSMNRTKGESMAPGKRGATNIFLEESFTLETDDCIIWPFSLDAKGYAQASEARVQYKPHRRVCEWAHGAAPTPKHHAAHLCGNRPCINKRHLVWATATENEQHKLMHGSIRRSAQRTLTDDQVRDIRRRYAGGEQMIVLAAEYGISNVAISKIVKWRSYRDVAV